MGLPIKYSASVLPQSDGVPAAQGDIYLRRAGDKDDVKQDILLRGSANTVVGFDTDGKLACIPSATLPVIAKTAAFDAVSGLRYAVDTTAGAFAATLPPSPSDGDTIEFYDARGTFGTNALTIARNGKKIFGNTNDFFAQTTLLSCICVYIDSTQGWSIYTGISIPFNVSVPVVTGKAGQGSTLTTSNGTWPSAPTEYAYQWQTSADGMTGWTNIDGATASTYVGQAGDVGNYLRSTVVATNVVGSSQPVPSAATAQVTEIDLLTGLVAHWGVYNDSPDAPLADLSGNGYNLTDNNSVGFAAGKVTTNASAFNGMNYLTNDAFGVTVKSVAFWIKAPTFSGYTTQFSALSSDGSEYNFVVQGVSGGQIRLYLNDLEVVISSVGIDDDSWHFIAVTTYEEESKIYVDGILDTTGSGGLTTAGILGIGADALGRWDFLTGVMNSIDVYSRTLSATDVTTLYNGGAGLPFSSYGA